MQRQARKDYHYLQKVTMTISAPLLTSIPTYLATLLPCLHGPIIMHLQSGPMHGTSVNRTNTLPLAGLSTPVRLTTQFLSIDHNFALPPSRALVLPCPRLPLPNPRRLHHLPPPSPGTSCQTIASLPPLPPPPCSPSSELSSLRPRW